MKLNESVQILLQVVGQSNLALKGIDVTPVAEAIGVAQEYVMTANRATQRAVEDSKVVDKETDE